MVTVPVKTVNSAQNLKCLTLRQLLDCCSSPSSPQWEIAWHILISRFEGFIYNKAYSRCLNWHIPRLCRQFSEVVNDVNGEVLYKLCKNQCKALQDFRKRDSERAFLSWPGKYVIMRATISSRKSLRTRLWKITYKIFMKR